MRLITFSVLLLLFASCKKTEVEQNTFLDIVDTEVEIFYNLSEDNSYYIIEYEASEMLRVFWHSADSFNTIVFNDTVKTAVINYGTYTREDGTGCQIVYFNKSNIGDTLDVYATAGELIDSIKVIINKFGKLRKNYYIKIC